MAELTPIGTNARDHILLLIQSAWTRLTLLDSAGNKIIELPTTDQRCQWTHEPGAATMVLKCAVKGSDADIKPLLPLSIYGAEVSKPGGAMMEPRMFAKVSTINDTSDSVDISLTVAFEGV